MFPITLRVSMHAVCHNERKRLKDKFPFNQSLLSNDCKIIKIMIKLSFCVIVRVVLKFKKNQLENSAD